MFDPCSTRGVQTIVTGAERDGMRQPGFSERLRLGSLRPQGIVTQRAIMMEGIVTDGACREQGAVEIPLIVRDW